MARRGGACLDTEIRVKVEFDAKIKNTSVARREQETPDTPPRRRHSTKVMRVTVSVGRGRGRGPTAQVNLRRREDHLLMAQ